ncbi:hypothetical protein [Zavarzinella formosa]|uniref:hypothetical protein n=1 Tax=Zavarzinella formosa TaxID=360055 RepID=UPI00030B019E|nr:hypothetical protein [Zavarzinella formosa]
MTAHDLIEQSDNIRENHPHYWRDEQAQAELKALWGDAINAQGVFTGREEEILYDRDGYKAVVSIGTANGVYAFGSSFETPTQGFSDAPSIWDELFETHAEARTAAIGFLLKRLPEAKFPHEHTQREQLDRMRKAVANILRQPTLF